MARTTAKHFIAMEFCDDLGPILRSQESDASELLTEADWDLHT